MKKIIAILLCIANPCWATYAYNGTAHVKDSVVIGNPTVAGDMTGSDLLIAAFGTDSATYGISDSSSNTWTKVAEYISNGQRYLSVWIAINPTVTNSQTFTPTSGGSTVIPINVVGLSGSDLSSPFDVKNGQGAIFVDTLAAGSITPNNDNSLIFSAYYYTRSGAASIDSSMTLIDDNEVGAAIFLGTAYKIQTTATAINPTWSNTPTGNVYIISTVESFKAAAAAATTPACPSPFCGVIE